MIAWIMTVLGKLDPSYIIVLLWTNEQQYSLRTLFFFLFSYITFQDVKDLFGSSGHGNDEMFQMWQDGMAEYACPLGRITYDDFRMILKGRGRELEEQKMMRRQSSLKKVTEGGSLLLPVPEGSISPQVKNAVFAKFDDAPASLKMPMLDPYPEPDHTKPEVNIKFPVDLTVTMPPAYKRTRSGSLGSAPLKKLLPEPKIMEGLDESEEMEAESEEFTSRTNRSLEEDVVSPRNSRGDPLAHSERNSEDTFKQHNEFRRSVLKASRTFEAKVLARKLQIAAHNQAHQATIGNARPSLIMRRGAQNARPELVHLGESERTTGSATTDKEATPGEVADACRRGGRARRDRRKRTTSDISGMLK